jgi:hypothetical protein
VYDAPEWRRSCLIEGAMKTSGAGVSSAMSTSICESAIFVVFDGLCGEVW